MAIFEQAFTDKDIEHHSQGIRLQAEPRGQFTCRRGILGEFAEDAHASGDTESAGYGHRVKAAHRRVRRNVTVDAGYFTRIFREQVERHMRKIDARTTRRKHAWP